jgi:ribosomal protein L22
MEVGQQKLMAKKAKKSIFKMVVKAKLNYFRMSPRKVRMVAKD